MFILKEFQTCDVSSTTDVAQLDACILENITTKPRQLQFCAALPSPNARFCQTRISSSSPVTPACRGEHAGTRPCKTEDRYIQLFRERLSEKVQATIPKGIVGGFEFSVLQRNLKELARKAMEVCFRVLKESNNKGSTATVSGTVY